MAGHRKRRRKPLGLLTPEELLVHRELEFLRVAGQAMPRGRSERRRHAYHVRQRAEKLEAARRMATSGSA